MSSLRALSREAGVATLGRANAFPPPLWLALVLTDFDIATANERGKWLPSSLSTLSSWRES